jgi:hypothetical protein
MIGHSFTTGTATKVAAVVISKQMVTISATSFGFDALIRIVAFFRALPYGYFADRSVAVLGALPARGQPQRMPQNNCLMSFASRQHVPPACEN